MRFARISVPGSDRAIQAPVTADARSIDLGGAQIDIPPGGFAPAVKGWVYGPLLNEAASLVRFGDQLHDKPYVAPPTVPVMYFKPPNTHVGHQARITLPAYADRVELGASLGLVFGRQTSRASAQNGLDNVTGYTIVLDLSVPNDSIYRPPVQEKCFDGACPIGPWVVDKADIADPQKLIVKTFVNGALKAQRNFDDLIRPPAQLAADVTEFMTLSEGDVLTLGYPVGAVPTAGPGDHVRIEIDGIGALDCTIAEKE